MKSYMRKYKATLAVATIVALGASTAPAEVYLGGFTEVTHALRVESNNALDGGLTLQNRDYPRGDVRAQLRLSGSGERDEYFIRMDFLSDYALNKDVAVEIREAYLKLYVASWLDVKVGRQVATWGTGDLVFVNDLFAKDWVAFFTGQELSYLKRPQDLARLSFYKGGTTFEFLISPNYTMDNLPTGERFSIFNPFSNRTVGLADAAPVIEPAKTLGNAEIFARISGYLGSAEWALYGYRGFYGQPLGATADSMLFAPRMSSVGVSLRTSLRGVLVNAEGAIYNSEEDSQGTNPLIPNTSIRTLIGAEKSLGNDLSVSAQWIGELTTDYEAFAAPFISNGALAPDEVRHTATLRLSKLLWYQTLRLSFFGFWGISDEDYYLRLSVEYTFSDDVKIIAGANWLGGKQVNTIFGQFQDNSNLYVRLRRSF